MRTLQLSLSIVLLTGALLVLDTIKTNKAHNRREVTWQLVADIPSRERLG